MREISLTGQSAGINKRPVALGLRERNKSRAIGILPMLYLDPDLARWGVCRLCSGLYPDPTSAMFVLKYLDICPYPRGLSRRHVPV